MTESEQVGVRREAGTFARATSPITFREVGAPLVRRTDIRSRHVGVEWMQRRGGGPVTWRYRQNRHAVFYFEHGIRSCSGTVDGSMVRGSLGGAAKLAFVAAGTTVEAVFDVPAQCSYLVASFDAAPFLLADEELSRLVRAGRDPDDLAREFEPTGQSIRNWIADAEKKEGRRDEVLPGLSAAERDELVRLRRGLRLEKLYGTQTRISGKYDASTRRNRRHKCVFHRIGASWRAGVVDTVVTSTGARSWSVEDRLARVLGTITLSNEGQFLIRPAHGKLSEIKTGPFASLDLAMAEIENQTKGACQLTTGM